MGRSSVTARSLINMIEMISTSSHRYADTTSSFTREAGPGQEAATMRPGLARGIATTMGPDLKYGQDQTRATMSFVEQCGFQALNTTAKAEHVPQDAPAKPAQANNLEAVKSKGKKDG